jgi:hypothetical protein
MTEIRRNECEVGENLWFYSFMVNGAVILHCDNTVIKGLIIAISEHSLLAESQLQCTE